MDYSYEYMYGMDDEVAGVFGAFYIVYYLFTIGLGIAGYVLSSLGLCTIAKRRGIEHPWLAWIPVASAWIVGSISDQYRYVTKGQIKNKRKTLVILQAVIVVLTIALFVAVVVGAMGMADVSMNGTEAEIMSGAMSIVLWAMLGALVIGGVGLANLIIYYMAMYDVYTSVNPPYNVVFLVLSIIFKVTEPFFIFFNRKKDLGMPPRCDIPAQAVQPEPQYLPPQPPIQEPWESNPEAE
ncbi:MAG: hypothetical protein IJZ39_02790 [Oscillospiraceae bacterium]|nr:hypothetical protein [Oscillospiraceae bacterium]